jgi:hypothetical protein
MGNNFELIVPGSAPLANFEQMIKNLEKTCNLGVSDTKLTAAQYYNTLRDLYFSVPFAKDDSELTLAEKDTMLERMIGCSKTVFMSRVKTRLRQFAKEQAEEKANRKKLRGR